MGCKIKSKQKLEFRDMDSVRELKIKVYQRIERQMKKKINNIPMSYVSV